ncbi:MAG TPA: acetyl-CoA carboxylase biotin carboxyl carrier protein subunit [Longimicrobiales bacterium]|nr:acetyl-CoA carboxylase biotin carboxyl carrier protein subunit [Longimicrobiales bacterium]
MRYFVSVDGHDYEIDLGPDGAFVNGEPVAADLAHVEGTSLRSLILDGRSHPILVRRAGSGAWDLHLRGRRYHAEAVDERTHAIRAMTGAAAGPVGPRPVRAPMPGLVVKIEVSVGDTVAPGQGVAIVEAMKMENELKADSAGVVTRIHVEEGEAVEKDQVLIEMGPEAPGEAED